MANRKHPFVLEYTPRGAFRPQWFFRMSPDLQARVLKSQARSWRCLTQYYSGLNAKQHRGFFAARQSMLDGIDYVWDLIRFTGISKRRVEAYETDLEGIYDVLATATHPEKFGAKPKPALQGQRRASGRLRRHRLGGRSARGNKRGK